jgi:hypothetical protein
MVMYLVLHGGKIPTYLYIANTRTVVLINVYTIIIY